MANGILCVTLCSNVDERLPPQSRFAVCAVLSAPRGLRRGDGGVSAAAASSAGCTTPGRPPRRRRRPHRARRPHHLHPRRRQRGKPKRASPLHHRRRQAHRRLQRRRGRRRRPAGSIRILRASGSTRQTAAGSGYPRDRRRPMSMECLMRTCTCRHMVGPGTSRPGVGGPTGTAVGLRTHGSRWDGIGVG